MRFAPVAIVGRACVLPGALTPADFWQAVRGGRDLVGPAPTGRWGIAAERALCAPGESLPDRAWSDRGGYVSGFDKVFDADGFAIKAAEIARLDPVFQWVLHTAREALRDAGTTSAGLRTGAVFGNLSFPTASMSRFADAVWRDRPRAERPDPRNRFHSGLPALLLERALGLTAGAFALDAACASSLYAIKTACDWLHDGRADLALAGAVNCADDLFIHIGFCALSAMSRSGRSRPFHAAADGLVPAEGAAFLALRRLDDAVRDGDHIHGVIRAVGLSNDGRGKGFLVPSREGQVRALRAAYEAAALTPKDISLLECHATGTRLGDATEIEALREVFAGVEQPIPIGSLKSNLGHLVTAAGVAGTIKVLEAMHAGVRPPTLHIEEPMAELTGTPFRLLAAAEPWTVDGRDIRRAGISAFGFGGNNAHLIVEEYVPGRHAPVAAARAIRNESIAVVGVGVIAAKCPDRTAFAQALRSDASHLQARSDGTFEGRIDEFPIDVGALGIPPNDLGQTLAQQLLMLAAGRQAVAEVGALPRERSGVYVGMGVDTEIARYGGRWRADHDGDGFIAALTSAGVIGTMPNIVANRLNRHLDLGGPSCSVSAEECSGLEALELAVSALRRHELDTALVGAVDLSCAPVHLAAALECLPPARQIPGDAATALVLKRHADAVAAGDHIYAVLGADDGYGGHSGRQGASDKSAAASGAVCEFGPDASLGNLTPRFGHAHAASGLLHVAAAALSLQQRILPNGEPWLAISPRRARVSVRPMEGTATSRSVWTLTEAPPSASIPVSASAPFHVYSGANSPEVLAALAAGRTAPADGARLVIVADDAATLATRTARARAHIEHGAPAGEGVHFRSAPVRGDVAFVFASAGTAYHGMGRELLQALPLLGDRLARRFHALPEAMHWAFADPTLPPTATDRLWGASILCQLHSELSLHLLGLTPHAAIGYSSGESNSLFALGAWTDMDAMRRDIDVSGLFDRELGGRFDAVARAWNLAPPAPCAWAVWNVLMPAAHVRAAIADRPLVHLAIIHGPNDCVIAGAADDCDAIVQTIGAGRCRKLEYNIAAHVPEVDAFREPWLHIHRRHVSPVDGVRFYSAGVGASYAIGTEACAQAIFAQAHDTLDFQSLIERAWQDGVRIFIEHGPQAACSGWIREILDDRMREAVVVALDHGSRGVAQVFDVVAALMAAGVAVDPTPLLAALADGTVPAQSELPAGDGARPRTILQLPAHPAPVRIGAAAADETVFETMARAPTLPSVLDESGLPATVAPVAAAGVAAVAFAAPVPSPRQQSLAQVAAIHTRFVEQQAAVHRRFLALHSRLGHAPGAALTTSDVAVTILTPEVPDPPTGLILDRAGLEIHAAGRISTIYGPLFEQQDTYTRQVRMPAGLLLLADRMTGIDAVPGVAATGTLWSETDVRPDSWYLHRGRMPAGILIESGQADLMLISYMGADFHNRGERVYRLLGCQLTFENDLPRPGDTLHYDIHIDGHANQGDIRLFFFHYDCVVDGKPQIRIRNGQAGFFSDAELADSAGILWSAEQATPAPDARLDPPAAHCTRSSFTATQVRAFAEGRPWECFGPGFELCRTHTSTPNMQSDRMLFLDEVTCFDASGGPWGRGYLRAESAVQPDAWYFAGHFQNDPCMPGTLMFEGCLQALSLHLAGLGFTIARDGWRFQPVRNEAFDLRCRGQVTPDSRHLVYEVFVEEVIAGPNPTVYADLLCTIDGLKAFHARRVGLELVPDWPLESDPGMAVIPAETKAIAGVPTAGGQVFDFGYPSLLACAWGKPSKAFGPLYARFDGPGRVPRLPGPPYHFVSRVTRVHGEIGAMQVGSKVEVEYDVPPEAWYFADNGARSMPFAVLLEAALQPCGWLASYIGSALTTDQELAFRNLDGSGTLHAEVLDNAGTLTTAVELTNISRSAGMIIVSFTVQCRSGERRVYDLTTVFGFFPPAALVQQVGQATTNEQRALLTDASEFFVEIETDPRPNSTTRPTLGRGRLRMLDRVTGYWPDGGSHGLGRVRAERRIDADDWYFKAHFFQDPVQPGSLGIEAMVQLLQFAMLEKGMDAGLPHPRFEPLALGGKMSWKYRGQVIPTNRLVVVTLDLTTTGEDDRGRYATATASLWCDGVRIYSADNLGMRIVAGRDAGDTTVRLDPLVDRWLGDHRPTWNRPALPMMSIVDRLAAPVPGTIIALEDVQVKRWVDFTGPRTLRTEVTPLTATTYRARLWDAESEVASARIHTGDWPVPPPAWSAISGDAMADPYESGRLFHGPAFQLWRAGLIGREGASTILDAALDLVPVGRLHPALLDAALHGIPHDRLSLWSDRISDDKVGYPARITELRLFGPTPTSGSVRCEVRFDGFAAAPDLPRFRVQLLTAGGVWAEFVLLEACFPKGRLGSAAPLDRRAFLRDHRFVDGLSLARRGDGKTRLSAAEVAASNWMPGTLEGVYGTADPEAIAIREHTGAREQLHPGLVTDALPITRAAVEVTRDGDDFVVRDHTGPRHDLTLVRRFWASALGLSTQWLGQDLIEGLIARYVGRVVLADPTGFEQLRGRGAIFVANHQVQIESILVTHLLAGLLQTPLVTMANAKHERGWIGTLLGRLFRYPGCRSPRNIVYFDPATPAAMFDILAGLRGDLAAGTRAFFVHSDGTRARSSREPVRRISSLFLDLAVELAIPIVPVRFVGGLPVEPLPDTADAKLEFPVAHTRQDYIVGPAISPDRIRALPYAERRELVLDAMNSIGPAKEREAPGVPDARFATRVEAWSTATGASEVEATFYCVLEALADPGPETQRLLDGARAGELVVPDDAIGHWLAEVARALYGPRGPSVRKTSA